MLNRLIDKWADEDVFLETIGEIKSNNTLRTLISGMDGTPRSYFSAALAHYSGRQALVVASDHVKAEKIYTGLSYFYPGQVNLLPARELFVGSELYSRSEEQQHTRLRFLSSLLNNKQEIWVAPAAALMSRILPPNLWLQASLDLQVGNKLERELLVEQLAASGYERESLTEVKGKFSVRGDIVDIYPPDLEKPLRVEFFDNVIESIRTFNSHDQRSKEKVQKVNIIPARELFLGDRLFQVGEKKIRNSLEQALDRLTRRREKETTDKLRQQIERHLQLLPQPEGLDNLSSYFAYFYGQGASFADYFSPGSLLIIEEPAAFTACMEDLARQYSEYLSSMVVAGELLLPPGEPLWEPEQLIDRVKCPVVGLSLFPEKEITFKFHNSRALEAKNVPFYHGQRELFKADYQTWLADNYEVYLVADHEERAKGLLQFIDDSQSGEDKMPTIMEGSLDEGFTIPAIKLALVTERNLLPLRKKKRRIRQREGIRLSDYRELAIGDYVVHEQHGIGRYGGLNTLEVGGNKRDYLFLKYRGTDKLYIPVEQVGLIQKYSSGESPAPRLHSLGGGEWQNLKKKVSRSVEELARDLLALYAARQAVEGYRFGPDHPWQAEFEAQFPFEETPDQLKAIEDVKKDLEQQHPMDRLLCGDVGYGKTEVAMRAAFKAAMEGKQTALLVPTTILAQQHFRTFSERFSGFPVRVAQLSRFVSASKQKEIIEGLAIGRIDIIIGTHRLLSGDVRFHDLGLLVVDEEHRFGVKQKEKMKRLRLEVDTLAMTATPIPRTLYLSLSGGRDFSIIDTPPEDRYPIQTYVLEYSETLVREAIQRELSREGQIFIVYNRVESIDRYAEKIRNLFPQASIAVGHGQMPERSLEKIMAGFQEGLYQILVSTTIIESGLDIPNVNTLIICDADRFGLAQLYQIRGRVGRSNRIAYAYFTYRKDRIISETAKKRLRAVKELTELGSGFKLALRDLEIRGAGNILGAEQHGFIAAVGFDMYTRLLEEAVARLKNEKRPILVNPRLELNQDAYIPASYIAAQDQKVDFYQRIYGAVNKAELEEIGEELIDRYGPLPLTVQRLIKVANLRSRAIRLGIEYIGLQNKNILIQWHPKFRLSKTGKQSTRGFENKEILVISQKPLMFKIKDAANSKSLLEDLGLFLEPFEEEANVEAGSL